MEQRLSRFGGVLYLIIIALRIFGEAFAGRFAQILAEPLHPVAQRKPILE